MFNVCFPAFWQSQRHLETCLNGSLGILESLSAHTAQPWGAVSGTATPRMTVRYRARVHDLL
eukprot:6363587-Alexandrium_andersonii.AAC.1